MSDKPILRQSQLADLAFMIATPRCALLHDPGVGKTPPVAVYTYYCWTQEGRRTVMIQPASLMRKNKNEILRFTNFQDADVAVFEGTKQEKEALLCGDPKVLIMTATHWYTHWRTILERFPDIGAFVGDEWHMLYSTNDSKRTMDLYSFFERKRDCRLVGMTGTLIDGRLSSAYPLIRLFNPRFYGSYRDFIGYHAVTDEDGKIDYWINHDRIAAIMGRYAVRRTFSDEYGAESKVLLMERVEMAPKMAAAYDEFHEMAALELERTILDGTEPGVAAIRARQILSHPETFGLCKGETSAKDERLLIHLEGYRQSGLTNGYVGFAALVPEVERIAALIADQGFRVGMIHGGVNTRKRAEISEAYEAGDLDWIVATPGTAAVGYNWHRTREMHFFSMNYKDSDFIQALQRGERRKRDYPLKAWIYKYVTTIEEHIHRVIERKSADAHKVDPTRNPIRFPRDDESGIDLNFFVE